MKRRLVVAITGVALVALVLFALPLGVVMSRTYRDEALLRLQRDAFAATRQIDLGAPRDPLELPTLRGGQLAVYGRTSVRVAGRGPQRPDCWRWWWARVWLAHSNASRPRRAV